MKRGAVRLVHHDDNNQLILMAATIALRGALTAYLERRGVLDEPSIWRRL